MSDERKQKKLIGNAVFLINLLQKQTLRPDQLSSHQRKVIVKYFMEEQSNFSNVEIGELVGVTNVHVSRLKRELLRNSLWEIEALDVEMLAVSLKKKKDELQRRAMQISPSPDLALVWKIENDFIEKMCEMGFIKLQPARLLVGHVDLGSLEIQLKEFFVEHGIPTAEAFVDTLRKAIGGDGAEPVGLLVAGDQRTSTEGGPGSAEGQGAQN